MFACTCVRFVTQVQLHLLDHDLHLTLLDIALKGALLQATTPQRLTQQMPHRLVLTLAEDTQAIEMRGKIAHLEATYIGVACDNIDLHSLIRLRRLLTLKTGDAALMDRELAQRLISPIAIR